MYIQVKWLVKRKDDKFLSPWEQRVSLPWYTKQEIYFDADSGMKYIQYLQTYPGFYSLSGKTSYRQIMRSIEAAKLDFVMIVPL